MVYIAETPSVVYTIDRSKVVPVLFFLCVAFWLILWGDLYCLALHFVLAFFQSF